MTIAPGISMNSVDAFLNVLQDGLATDSQFLSTAMTRSERDFLSECWDVFAHTHQVPPDLAPNGAPWLTWLMIGGRGDGKTRAGAEWVRAQALGQAPLAREAAGRIALVGETEHEVREVMIEGVSGLL